MQNLEMKIIAYIKTDFPQKFGIPRQSGLAEQLKAKIVFLPRFGLFSCISRHVSKQWL